MVSFCVLLCFVPLSQVRHLVAPSPLALAPVGTTAEVLARAAEVRARAAETLSTLLVNDRTASLAGLCGALGGRRFSRCLLVVALSKASLASGTAVEVLVLEVVLGSAVAGRGATAVEVTIGTSTGAADTALGVTADVNFRDAIGEGWRGRRGAAALGRSTREGL